MPPHLIEIETQKIHQGNICAMCSGCKSGKVFASAGVDKMLYLWSVDEDQPLLKYGPFSSEINCCDFDKSEEFIALGTSGGLVTIIDLNNNKTICSWNHESGKITCICIHPKLQKHVFVGDDHGMVSLYNSSRPVPIQKYHAHIGVVNCIRVAPQLNIIGSCGNDKTLSFFDISTGETLGNIRKNFCPVTSLAFHPTEKIVASCATDRSIKLFDLNRTFEMDGAFIIGKGSPTNVSFSADGRCVIACSPYGISIFKVEDTNFSDHLPFNISNTYSMNVFQTGIAITSSYGSIAKYVLLDANDFPLLNERNKINSPMVREHSVPVHVFDQNAIQNEKPIPARKKQAQLNEKFLAEIQINKKQLPPSNSDPSIYREFSNDRKSYMAALSNRLKALNSVRDLITKKGTDKALEAYAKNGCYTQELFSVLQGRRDTIHIGNASSLIKIASKNLESDEKDTVAYINEVLSAVAPIVRATLTEKNSVEVLSIMHELYPKLKEIADGTSVGAAEATQLITSFPDIVQ